MLRIDGNTLTVDDVINVALNNQKVELSPGAVPAINKSREFVDRVVGERRVVYGITTGFGELANTHIESELTDKLQENFLRSHSVGVGRPLKEDAVRGLILLRANALAKGFSGVRLEIIEKLIALLNNDIYPYIPCQGSVGASGDLAPLAHLALFLVGEGEGFVNGRREPAEKILLDNGIKPAKLKAKEGLGLTNGTQLMSSLGCLALNQAKLLVKNAQVAAAMSIEALKGTAKAFDKKIHNLRPHPGQLKIAENMRSLVAGSKIMASHADCQKVQDAYTLRCIPQVYGAVVDTINYVEKVLSIEINSATDNPLIFPDEDEAISGGNFHGEPLAFAMDYLGIALSEIGNISERTIDRLVNPHVSGLPPFLSKNSGLNSGFMIAQYTAASLVSENKILAHPASVDSIPTSAGQEDHVSMGPIAARHARDILSNVENVLAVEMLAAAQGIDCWEESPGFGATQAYDTVRKHVPFMNEDRILYHDIDKIRQLINNGSIVKEVEKAVKLI
ncbi:MAG: histidine ammonia-lyase [Victivallales bacterium]|nr:histidine ammonia-lyase [Victivallales bacterium]MCF7889497.1 histidine ammonia-lyase [Victivallales bacterium]